MKLASLCDGLCVCLNRFYSPEASSSTSATVSSSSQPLPALGSAAPPNEFVREEVNVGANSGTSVNIEDQEATDSQEPG